MTRALLRRAALAALFLVMGVAGPAQLAACGSFDASTPAAESEAAAADAAAADAALDDAPQVDASPSCGPGAFCDSFDDDRALPRDWSSMTTRLLGTLARVPDGGTQGSGGLLASAHAFDGGVASEGGAAADYHNAYLRHEIGVNGPAAYTLVLSFSARAEPLTSALVQGPRFQTVTAASENRELIIEFRDGFTRVSTYAPGCDAGCALKNTTETNVGRTWHRYVMTVNAHPSDASGYGRVSLSVDEQVVLNEVLPFNLSALKKYATLVGLTYAPPPFAGAVTFDDVSIKFTPAL
jgi:hypothetical protein